MGGTSREVRVERLEGRRLFSTIAMFYNASYVNTSPNAATGDSYNLLFQLVKQGNLVNTFSATDATGFHNGLNNASVLVIPALDKADLASVLSPATITEIQTFVTNGGGVLVAGDPQGRDTAFLDTVFGYAGFNSPANPPTGNYALNPGGSSGTVFSGGYSLSRNNNDYPVATEDLPVGSKSIFQQAVPLGGATAVALLPYAGKNQVAYLSWDYTNGGPSGTQNGNWNTALSQVVDQLTGKFTPAAVAFITQPTTVAAGTAIDPAVLVAVVDVNGNIVPSDLSSINISILSGPTGGTISGASTVPDINGVSTFANLRFTVAGDYQLLATDIGFFGFQQLQTATSILFTVHAASPAQLVYASEPSNVTAGVPFAPSVVVNVDDAYGNLVTTDISPITINVASGPPGATTSGTTTVNAVNGVATFDNLTLTRAAGYIYTLVATDGQLAAAVSTPLSVTPAAPTMLAFATPVADGTVNSAIAPVVIDVTDPFGNTVTSSNFPVAIAIASAGRRALTGSTVLTAYSGVATFNNLIFSLPGQYTLAATATGLTGTTSSTFNVVADVPNKLAFATQPSTVTAGNVIAPAIVVNVLDVNGAIVTTDNSTVTLSISSGPLGAALGGTVTAQAVNGVATFNNVILTAAGNYQLTASDGAIATALSATFTVIPAAATQLAFSTIPTTINPGVILNPAVAVGVLDKFGNVVTTDTSFITIALASFPTGGALTGTTTVKAVKGVARFTTLSLSALGAYTFKATDGALTPATSTPITVTPVKPVQLLFSTQPTSVAAKAVMTPAVVLRLADSFGTAVTGVTSPVTLKILTGPTGGTIGGTLTVNAVNGVATFSNLTFSTPGTYTLGATSGTLVSVPSSLFVVAGSTSAKLVVFNQPTNGVAGKALGSIVIHITDAAGNLVPTDTSAVTITVSAGPQGGVVSGTATVNAVGGIATFNNVVLTTSGSYILRVSDGLLVGTDLKPIAIAVAPAAKLVFAVQPKGGLIGNAITVKIEIEDAYGNIVQNPAVTVSLGVASGPGTFTGPNMATSVLGFATFAGLKFSSKGTYTLRAIANPLASALSAAFILI